MLDQEQKFAILIDADNISDKYIKTIIDETTKFGIATYKRIYGDWTDTKLSSWKNILLENSIVPIQQYSYTSGKNSTDSAMIIDAMDILYSDNVNGFCIVSSDSDFTKLSTRLREAGKIVVGMGERKTPKPFIAACNHFKYLDILYSNMHQSEDKPVHTVSNKSKNTSRQLPAEKSNNLPHLTNNLKDDTESQTSLETIRKAIMSLVDEGSDEDGRMYLADIGNQLAKRFPDFDVRNFGFSKLTPFLKSLNLVDIKSDPTGIDNRVKRIYIKSRQV